MISQKKAKHRSISSPRGSAEHGKRGSRQITGEGDAAIHNHQPTARPAARVACQESTHAQRASRTVSTATVPAKTSLPIGPALRTKQAARLTDRLAHHVAGAIDLVVTDNRAVMVTVRRDAKHHRYTVRAHHIFVDAPATVLAALAAYVTHDCPRASRELGRYIDDNDHRITQNRAPRYRPIRARGHHHDLDAIFERLNQSYFAGEVEARVTWGRNVARGQHRHTIRLGSYTFEEALIRIHPGLDQEWVPCFYVEWVLFHEMLHAVHSYSVVNGRRRFHGPEFTADEERFVYCAEARAWERRNLAALLCI